VYAAAFRKREYHTDPAHDATNGICIAFAKGRQFEISRQNAIFVVPALQCEGGFLLLKHWNVRLTAPAK
jgi:hypothetical protein